jgi:hypothetical protein
MQIIIIVTLVVGNHTGYASDAITNITSSAKNTLLKASVVSVF